MPKAEEAQMVKTGAEIVAAWGVTLPDGVVWIGESLYCLDPTVLERTLAVLRDVGYQMEYIVHDERGVAYDHQGRRYSYVREGIERYLWFGAIPEVEKFKCFHCGKYFSDAGRVGMLKKDAQCEYCHQPLHQAIMPGKELRFSFISGNSAERPTLTGRVVDWEDDPHPGPLSGYVYVTPPFTPSALEAEGCTSVAGYLARHVGEYTRVERNGEGCLRIPRRNIDIQRNFMSVTVWDDQEYQVWEFGRLPIPFSVFLCEAWRSVPVKSEVYLRDRILHILGVELHQGLNALYGTITPQKINDVYDLLRHLTSLDAEEWKVVGAELPGLSAEEIARRVQDFLGLAPGDRI